MKKIVVIFIFAVSIFSFNYFVFDKADFDFVTKEVVKGKVDILSNDFQKAEKLMLSGEWEYFNNQLLKPEDLAKGAVEKSIFKNTSSELKTTNAGNNKNYATVRMILNAPAGKNYRITLFPYNSHYRLWINGKNVYGMGFKDDQLLKSSRLRYVDLDSSYVSWDCASNNGKIELIMQLSQDSFTNGIYTSIQDAAAAQSHREIKLVVFSMLVGGILLMGFFYLNYFIVNRRYKSVLYLGFMCLGAASAIALNYLDYAFGQAIGYHLSYEMLKYLRRIPQAILLVSGAMFTNNLYTKDTFKYAYKLLNFVLALWLIMATFLFTVGRYELLLKLVSYGNIVVLGYLVYYMAVMLKALINKRRGAKIFFTSILIAGVASLHDALLGMGIINDTNILFYYGILVLILTMSTYLSKNFSDTLNELETTADSLSRSHSALKSKNEELAGMWRQVTESRNELASLNENLEGIVEKRTSTIRNLFHNAGQGFLSIDRNLMVHDEYSRECDRIFQSDIRQKYLPELLFPDNKVEMENIRKIIDKAMETRGKSQVYLSLLPSEVEIMGRYIYIEYKLISTNAVEAGFRGTSGNEELMLILTDITEKHELEKQLEGKRESLEKVVKVIINRNDFEECIKDYRDFCSRVFFDIISSDSTSEKKSAEILRVIHNLKGNFSQFELTGLTVRLHDLEDLIIKSMVDFDIKTIKKLVDTEVMLCWLEEELDSLEKILGSEFFSKKNLVAVKMEKLLELEQIVIDNLSEDKQRLLLPKLRRLRYKPLGEMLGVYEGYVIRLAEQLEKHVNWNFYCEEVLVDTNKYQSFLKSLVHVYRNAMDHGMETNEERLELGKDEVGIISTTLKRSKNSIIIKISDDGRGLDTERIMAKAIEKGIYDKEQISMLSENEIQRLIFNEEFSTKELATQLSGRGVGLAAVMHEVELLGGYISVVSEIGYGTTFEFNFLEMQEE